eukprot:56127-Rhodomonas_salina.2
MLAISHGWRESLQSDDGDDEEVFPAASYERGQQSEGPRELDFDEAGEEASEEQGREEEEEERGHEDAQQEIDDEQGETQGPSRHPHTPQPAVRNRPRSSRSLHSRSAIGE